MIIFCVIPAFSCSRNRFVLPTSLGGHCAVEEVETTDQLDMHPIFSTNRIVIVLTWLRRSREGNSVPFEAI